MWEINKEIREIKPEQTQKLHGNPKRKKLQRGKENSTIIQRKL